MAVIQVDGKADEHSRTAGLLLARSNGVSTCKLEPDTHSDLMSGIGAWASDNYSDNKEKHGAQPFYATSSGDARSRIREQVPPAEISGRESGHVKQEDLDRIEKTFSGLGCSVPGWMLVKICQMNSVGPWTAKAHSAQEDEYHSGVEKFQGEA